MTNKKQKIFFEGNDQKNLTSQHSRLTSQQGITLIALIITIIVLLILAGVSISLLTGENSIIGKANEAKSSYNTASQTEADTIEDLIAIADREGSTTVTISQEIPDDWNEVHEIVVETGGGQPSLTAPIPAGWTASEITGENTISGGLVIYEGTITDWTDVNALQTTTNQYV